MVILSLEILGTKVHPVFYRFLCFQKMSVYELGDEFDEAAMSLSLIESGFRHTGNASETSSQVDINDL